MIEKILENLKTRKNVTNVIHEIMDSDDEKIENILYKDASNINRTHQGKLKYETNIYFPVLYEIKDNCPTCGYRTPESKRQYNSKYIESMINFKLDQIKQYNISSINCYNKRENKYIDSDIIFKTLDLHQIDKNIKIYNDDDFSLFRRYNFKNVIINNDNIKLYEKIVMDSPQVKVEKVILELNIDQSNIAEQIEQIPKNIRAIQLVGYDPFIDATEEYNPQYKKEYLLKILSIIRILYPETEIKIQHATNENNFYYETLKLGINAITGIYPEKFNEIISTIECIKNGNNDF